MRQHRRYRGLVSEPRGITLPQHLRVARRKLPQIHAATELASLRIPPGNPLEARKADRKGQHSIRIDDQWRVCIVWKTDGAYRFDIVD